MAEPNYNLLNTEIPYKVGGSVLKGMADVNALRSQQLENQAAEMGIQNALAEQEAYKQAAQPGGNVQQALMERGLGKQAVAYGKSTAEAQKIQREGMKLNLDIMRERTKDLLGNPSNENYIAHLQEGIRDGLITPDQAQRSLQTFASVPMNQRGTYLTQQLTKAEDFYKVQERQQGTVPAGYRMTSEGNLEAIPGGPTTTPLAPKDLQKREAAFPQAKASIAGYETKADNFVKDIDALIENKKGLDEITGYLAGRTELSAMSEDARRALALYKKIAAKGGFQALQDIRDMSKTGGALGNISNQEGKQLQSSFAALDRTQSGDDVRAVLEQVKSDIEGSKTRMRDAFDETYAYKSGGTAPAAGGAPVTGNSPAAQALARFRASRGQ